jgi:hypothetical protein
MNENNAKPAFADVIEASNARLEAAIEAQIGADIEEAQIASYEDAIEEEDVEADLCDLFAQGRF